MKKTVHPSLCHLSALAAAGLLAACGGGGSGDSSTDTPPVAASYEVAGVAAKGLLANANVSAHPIKDGQPDLNTTLASATTDANGAYSLKFAAAAGSVYAVRISAKTDGSTTQKDEITGAAQPLPSGFALRALLSAEAASGKAELFVTPFSEMAAAAAAKAGISKDSLQQAQSNVIQLLGFDPSKVKPADLKSAGSEDEKKLAVMLTSVAQLAAKGELGCAGGASAGDKVKCVVEKLAESSKLDSIKPGKVGDIDVAGKLVAAVGSVLADPKLNNGAVDPAALNIALKNLEGDGKPAPVSDAGAVAAGKTLFTELRSNLTALLAAPSAGAAAPLQAEADKFERAVADVQLPAELLLKDATALVSGVQLYLDYTQRDGKTVSRDGFFDMLPGGPANATGMSCGLYQDTDRLVLATAVANARYIGCSARYHARLINDPAQGGNLVWAYTRHRIFLEPQADGSFSYSARARKVICKTKTALCGANGAASQSDPQSAPATDFAGKISVTQQDYRIKSFSISGELPAMFRKDSFDLYNPQGKGVIALSGSRNVILGASAKAGDLETVALEGKLALYRDGGNTLDSELVIKPESRLVSRVEADGSESRELAELALNLLARNGSAEFEGQFSLGGMMADKSGSVIEPTKLGLKGSLRNKSGDSVSEFLSGQFSLALQNYAAYDASLPLSASNSYKAQVGFNGSVTAPNRPLLALSLEFGRSKSADALRDGKLSGQFKTVVNGAPKLVLSFEASEAKDAAQRSSLRISEAASGLNFAVDGASSLIDLKKGDVKIGVIDLSNGRVTFTNGEFVSLN
ncbi:hypothetical protein G8A07_01310 [Roseateles sp. DAIF2]|uniref:hypothetical protein n=1 Tax=Roseateles sp. DAIF2 TaxID=2714952 RepID=UPI0018A2FF65|nr:hypothetical protein [Roseateles sp. DAIF2]QPF71699.1 hypothetical protein G8A07_01310 [Roseateles sp. DAIF2]